MQIKHLSLKNFRNHTLFDWSPSPQVNSICGENGKGKTAVLEAISLLLLKRSFRQGKAWVKKGSEQSFLSLDFKKKEGSGNVQAHLDKKGKFLEYLVNNKKVRGAPYNTHAVFITPLDLNFVRGEASYRRRFIDELVLELSQGRKTLLDFQKILAQKNKFLKLCKKGAYSLQDKKVTLDSLNEMFLEKGALLVEKRLEALELLDPFWKQKGKEFLKSEDFTATYVGKSQNPFKKEHLEEEIYREKENELIRGVCLAGPQRHDLLLFWKGHEARDFLSQGQQKALLITWKLGQWAQNLKRLGEPPLLFFDDVFSEIDQQTAQKLSQFLLSISAQSFLTLTQKKEFLDQTNTLFFDSK